MEDIKVTAIVPIYNVEEYLYECLESLVNQTLEGIEVLMIDDGSTDNSAVIAKEFDKKYENFHYIYKENGGLGNARNFAIPFVKGQYITFVDSDDIIPSYAYQKMYEMALRTGNDMIVGNVKRFNSSKVWNSALHSRIFDANYEHTHIYEKPELVYDTTSWNKMFKTSFYLENKFFWPERILYEDIPVTVPAHFYANSVGIIEDVCYMWRVRDGQTKSITQNRNDIQNLLDRIAIMRMVNKFYDENVTDEKALYARDFKWLDMDLKIFINIFDQVDDDYLDQAINVIAEFLDEVNPLMFNEIRTIDKLKYYYILTRNKEKLLEVIHYENTTFKSQTITRKDNHYSGQFPIKGLDKEMEWMEKELSNYAPVQLVEKIRWKDDNLLIEGYFYLPKLDKQDDFKTEAYLENIVSHQKISLNIEKLPSKDLTKKYGIKFCKKPLRIAKYNYDHCRFRITLPANEVLKANDLKGIYNIHIVYSNDLVNNDFILSNKSIKTIKDNALKRIDDKKIFIDFINNKKMNLHFDDFKPLLLKDIDYNNKVIYFELKDSNRYTLLINKKENHSNNKDLISLKMDELEYKSTKIQLVDHEKLLSCYLDSNDKCIYNGEDLITITNNNFGNVSINKFKNVVFLKEMKKEKNTLSLTICIAHKLIEYTQRKPVLAFKNKKYNYIIKKALNEIDSDHLKVTYQVSMNFADIEEIKDFAEGNYEIYLETDAIHQYKIVAYNNQIKNIRQDNYHYCIFIDENSHLILSATYNWNEKENTPQKRRLIKKYIYPLLRKLPINDNTIVFESFWGNQYACNPQYLYEYIDKNHPDYKCVWFLGDERISINGKGERVRRGSYKYYYYLATAKFFVNNVNFNDVYEKRNGQIEIQTMHGTPLKTLGLDVKEDFPDEQTKINFLRRCHRWDYLIVQSDKVAEITRSCYDFKKEYLYTGYPRNDMLFDSNNPESIAALKEQLGLPTDKKIILYAPTWRKRNCFDMKLDVDDMKKKLGDEYILVLRLHHFSVPGLKESMLNDFVYNYSSYPSIQDLYLIADILITDYSSVMFDYSILNRPMLFFTYDIEDYRDNLRGFNFDFEAEAPGKLLKTYEEVISSIMNIDQVMIENRESYDRFRNKFIQYEKGNASKQVFDKVFKK